MGSSTSSSSSVLAGSRLTAVYSGQRYGFRPRCRIASSRAYTRQVTDRYSDLPPEPPSALAAVVLHAVVIGTPEATYDHLEGMETAQARRERIRLRDRLLTRTDLTTAERATLLDAQATDALLGGTADLDQLNA
jgi:hypothetical protein